MESRIYFGIITTWNPEKRIGFLSYNTAGPVRGERYRDLEAFFSKAQVIPERGSKQWVTKNCPIFFQIEKSTDSRMKDLAINVANAFGLGE